VSITQAVLVTSLEVTRCDEATQTVRPDLTGKSERCRSRCASKTYFWEVLIVSPAAQ
jgi:hypothetical protein